MRLQKTLALLAQLGDEEMAAAARDASARAMAIAIPALQLDEQRQRVRDLAAEV